MDHHKAGSFVTDLQAEFVKSSTTTEQCPAGTLPEYAFIGRSNVGKSSLINMLTGRKDLAKTSSKPGKTRCINHFIIHGQWYLADLPGYGYAKVSKKERNAFMKMIRDFLLERKNLMCVFVLIDSRIPPQQSDLDFMYWLGNNGIPFVIAFTKIDKLSSSELAKSVSALQRAMLKDWESIPRHFTTSAQTAFGKEALLGFIAETNSMFNPQEHQ